MIRVGNIEDVGRMLPLVRRALEEVQYHEVMHDSVFALRWSAVMDSGRDITVVSEFRGEITGVVLGLWAEDMFTTARFAVDLLWYLRPDQRGSGEGSRMIELFESTARLRGCTRVMLGAWEKFNPDQTMAKLSAMGYRPIERYAVKTLSK